MTRVVAWLLLLSCTTPRAVTTFSVPRAPVPWPSNVPSCVLDPHAWDSMCAPPLDITRDGVTIATIARPTYVTVRWSALPLLGTSTAHVQATASGLHVEGAGALARQAFVVRRDIDVATHAVRIPAGSPVSILGTTGASIAIAVDTGFTAPARVETTISCADFGPRSRESMPAGPPFARPNVKTIALAASPGGATVMTFTPDQSAAWVWLGSSADFVHIVGGHTAWRPHADRTSFVFDGWVRASDVKRVDDIDRDWDTSCELSDLMDTCGPSYVGRAATVHSTPRGPAIGTIDAGTHVAPGDKRDGFTAIKLPNGEIFAPAGSSFWIADGDLGGTCEGLSHPDGCPCP